MKAILKIDDYLIGNDEGTFGERLFYYGTYAICITIAVIIAL